MDIYISVFIGVLIYAAFQWNESFNNPKFNWMKNIIIPACLSLLTGFALAWAREDMKEIYPMTKISAIFVGVSGQAIFRKIGVIFDKNLNTVVGLNQEIR